MSHDIYAYYMYVYIYKTIQAIHITFCNTVDIFYILYTYHVNIYICIYYVCILYIHVFIWMSHVYYTTSNKSIWLYSNGYFIMYVYTYVIDISYVYIYIIYINLHNCIYMFFLLSL